ncbi:MAG TPA: GNAT family N-acetyltransferase [Longimicrobiaceae bacterium]|nr:GNAT family N-acetyltransferase [Longimicrobiaceae bacterium]
MVDELHIREGREGDTGQILDLLKASLGEGSIPRHREYWSWKHLRNPFGESPYLVAESGGRVVGLRVFMRWTWERQGETVHAVRAVDTATHPDWRGKGIFTRLTLALVEQLSAEGVSFVFNTPNEQSRPGYLKMGWAAVGRLSLWARPRPLRALGSFAGRGSGEEVDTGVGDGQAGSEGRPVAGLLTEPGLGRLLADSRPRDGRLGTPVSAEYLSWRYADIPGFEYRAAWALDPGEEAAVIFRFRPRGRLLELRFTEILAGPSRGAARRAGALLRTALRKTSADYAVAMAAPRTQARRALLLAGFLPVPRLGPILTVRPLSAEAGGTVPCDRSSWRLSIGDLELF